MAPKRPVRRRVRSGALLAVMALLAASTVMSGTPAGAQTEETRIGLFPSSGFGSAAWVEVWFHGWAEFEVVATCISVLEPGDPDDPSDPSFPSIVELCGERPPTEEIGPNGTVDFVWYTERLEWAAGPGRWVNCNVERCGWVGASWPDGGRLAWTPIQFAPPAPAPTTPPAITLRPGDTSGQVDVHVSGMRPGARAALHQCLPAPTGSHQCAPDHSGGIADATGAFSRTMTVRDHVTPLGGDPFECVPVSSCTIAVYDTDNPWTMPTSAPIPPPRPQVVPGAAAVPEGDAGTTVVEVPVALDAAVPFEVTARWTTAYVPGAPAGQAEPDLDYQPASGTVVFQPGATTATVPITVTGDEAVEADEYVVVLFGLPTNARMGGFWGLGFGGILDDD